jgi:type II secretory pathway component PulF
MSDEETIDRPRGLLITAVIVSVTTIWLALRFPRAVQSFEEIFKGFGAELSAPARFVIAWPHAWWIFALVSLGILAWVGAHSRVTRALSRQMRTALIILISVTALSFAFAGFALYQIIFKLGSAI